MIDSISLRNFKQFAELELELREPLVFIVGPNEAGKSTIRDAVSFALTGMLPGIDTRKAAIPVLMRDGARASEVSIRLGELEVRRRVTSTKEDLELAVLRGSELAERITGSVPDNQRRIEEYLGVQLAEFRIALDAWSYFGLADKARLAFLRQVFGAAPTLDQVLAALEKRGATGELATRAADLAVRGGFRLAEKEAVEWRRAAKREQQVDLGPPPPSELTIESDRGQLIYPLEKLTLAKMEEAIATLERERDQLLAKLGAELQETRRQIAELESKIGAFRKAQDHGAELQKIDAAIAERTDEIARLEREAEEWQAKVDPQAVDPGLVAKIEKPEVCPAIPHGFLCPVKPAEIKAHRAAVEAAREALLERHRASSEARAEVHARHIRIDVLRREREHLESTRAFRRTELERREALAAEMPRLERSLAAAREREVKLGRDAISQNEEMNALARRIEIGRRVLQAKRALDDYAARAAAIPAATAGAAEREKAADLIAEAMGTGSGGIEHGLLASGRKALLERMQITGSLLGHVELDEELDLVVQTSAGRRSFHQLSRSQRLRLGLVAQDLIAFRARMPFLILDEVDTYDSTRLVGLVKLLRELVGNPYKRILVLATQQVKDVRCPPGAQMIRLEHGIAQEVR